MEYLIAHGGSRGKTIAYELIYNGEGQQQHAFLMGLIDVSEIQKRAYDDQKTGVNTEKSGLKRPQNASITGSKRGSKRTEKPINIDSNAQRINPSVKSTSSEAYHHPSYIAQGVS